MKINFDMSLKLRENLVHKKRQFSQKISEKYRKKYSFKIKKITTAISEIPVINN